MKRTLASHLQQGQHHHIQSSSSTSAASSSQFQNPLDSELTNPQLFAEDVDERDFILDQGLLLLLGPDGGTGVLLSGKRVVLDPNFGFLFMGPGGLAAATRLAPATRTRSRWKMAFALRESRSLAPATHHCFD
ncbi:hypothetical protein OIU77_031464 [Salix suchowensis]|uniref:Uncharacterized protein n=1 Tax=Salix suchowensis TaxID=1278906 RepID=A0ABQ9BHK7_9ROSI|nr:hypothetical protein OIU77_031464 [Salix suchowensis]